MIKLLPNQINVIYEKENSGSESDIYNKIQVHVIVERDAESNGRQTEKTWKM